jgi:asparagine synthase (glutamine-hydrolysing)
MALTGILSVQILYDLYIKKNIPTLMERDIVKCDKVITDY